MSVNDSLLHIIRPSFEMNEPNDPVLIYSGEYILRTEMQDFLLNGKIEFVWLPNTLLKFSSHISKYVNTMLSKSRTILIDNYVLGDGYISRNYWNDITNSGTIEGFIHTQVLFGTDNYSVDKVTFEIVNLRNLSADLSYVDIENIQYPINSRLSFQFEDITINIDKLLNFEERFESLNNKGGYILFYTGELYYSDARKIKANKAQKVITCLNEFFSFINGRTCGILFRQGKIGQTVSWSDYKPYAGAQYQNTYTAFPRHSNFSIIDLWHEFKEIWNNENDKEYLLNAIGWYVEANSYTHALQTRLVIIQAALELMFNWIVLDKLKIINDDERTKLSASNKFRLLLYVLKADIAVPSTYTNFMEFCVINNLSDGVEGFVFIRNTLIHSQKSKLKSLTSLNDNIVYEAVFLGLWYLELSLLYVLKYKGVYYNRTSKLNDVSREFEVAVPWA